MKKNAIILILIILTISACTTYHVTTESMLRQFANMHADTRQSFVVDSPLVFPGAVTGNALNEIKVLDQKGNEHTIQVKYNTVVLIIKKDGTSKAFFFDTLIIQDNTIYGQESHFGAMDRNPIKLDDIVRIEVVP
ncbi:MAG TPA: hypothetical protein VFV08_04855 [Puia sp.]|nr:hypothetical protein [Puia sp.]